MSSANLFDSLVRLNLSSSTPVERLAGGIRDVAPAPISVGRSPPRSDPKAFACRLKGTGSPSTRKR